MASTPLPNPAGRYKGIEAQRVLPVFVAVLALIAVIGAIDVWLAGVAARHRSHVGQELFDRGVAAASQGRQGEALELFRGAFNHRPSDARYHLAFARSLHENGRREESRRAIQNLLAESPTFGSANAEFARMLAAAGDWQQAAWYYHRALYGEWSGDPDLRPLRFELAELLATHDATGQLLSELLILDATGGKELDARRMAKLTLAAEDWSRAERAYRDLLNENAADPGLLVGLARAQFGGGKYLAAERTFERALRSGAAIDTIQQELQLARDVNQLDPTIRRLPATEKHRRSHELASLILQPLTACSPDNPELTKAAAALQSHQRVRNPFAASEADLVLFEELWSKRKAICDSEADYPQAVALLGAQLVR